MRNSISWYTAASHIYDSCKAFEYSNRILGSPLLWIIESLLHKGFMHSLMKERKKAHRPWNNDLFQLLKTIQTSLPICMPKQNYLRFLIHLKQYIFFSAWFPYTCAHCALQLFKLIYVSKRLCNYISTCSEALTTSGYWLNLFQSCSRADAQY